jgi:hypothetical protein
MDKRERGKKTLKRLELRREVIRVLADDTLSRVAGGLLLSATCGEGPTDACSPCVPSK